MARRRSQQEISLFPFLAVLVCTMGALILLLLVTTRRIRDSKNAAREAAVAGAEPAMRPRTPFVAPTDSVGAGDFIILEGSQQGTPHQFASALQPAATLSELESEESRVQQIITRTAAKIRNARERVRGLQKQIADLEASAEQGVIAAARLKADKEELARRKGIQARLSKELQEQLRRLTKLRDSVKEQQVKNRDREAVLHKRESDLISLRKQTENSTARVESVKGGDTVIRFTNSSGTNRNPILINVVEDRFEFIPHTGISIRSDDLKGFPVTDNPLLSCVLTIHDARNRNSITAKPYVLLLVRPSGSMAFYMAQRTLKEAGLHFGYELIREDHPTVSTPPPMENERFLIRTTLNAAFKRRQELYAGIIRQPGQDSRDHGNGQRRLHVLPDGGVAQGNDRMAAAPRYYAGGAPPPPAHRRPTFGRWDPSAKRGSADDHRPSTNETVITRRGVEGSTEAIPFLRQHSYDSEQLSQGGEGGLGQSGRPPDQFPTDPNVDQESHLTADTLPPAEEGQFTQLSPQNLSKSNSSQQSGRPGTPTETAPPRTRTTGPAEQSFSAGGNPSVAASDQDDFLARFLREVEEQKRKSAPNPYLLALLKRSRKGNPKRDKNGSVARMPVMEAMDESAQPGGQKAGGLSGAAVPSSQPFEFQAPRSHARVTDTESNRPGQQADASPAGTRHETPQLGATSESIRIVLQNGVMSVGTYPSVNISTWGRQKVLAETARLLRSEIMTTGHRASVSFYISPEMQELQKYLAKELEPAGVTIDGVRKLGSDASIRQPQGTQQPASPVQVPTGNRRSI